MAHLLTEQQEAEKEGEMGDGGGEGGEAPLLQAHLLRSVVCTNETRQADRTQR